MAPQHLMVFFFLLLSGCTITAVTTKDSTGFVRSPDREILEKKENVSHFKFYWQDIQGGGNATSIAIVQPLPQWINSTSVFGLVRVIDNALTSGPERNSTLLGRAQGFYVATSQTELVLEMVMGIVLYDERYNGSSFNILGRNHAYDKVRELPVIGGSGVFRDCKGYALINTISFNTTSGDIVVEYNVYVKTLYFV